MAGTVHSDAGDRAGGPAAIPARAWLALALLTATMMINQVDRRVATLVIEPLKQEFHLSDSAIGFLTGLAFGLTYAVTVVPLGLMADRVSRRNLLATVVALWSAMTAVAGLAQSYLHLLLCRMGVGAAEAGSNPAAMSMISDLFPRARRATAIAIFNSGLPLGSLVCFVAGAWVVEQYGWRAAFVAAGALGLPLSLLYLVFLREPERGVQDRGAVEFQGTWRDRLAAAGRFCLADWRVPSILFGTAVLAATNTGVTGWLAPFLMRVHGLTIQEAGLVIALSSGVFGGLGLYISGPLTDRIARGEPRRMLGVAVGFILAAMVFGGGAILSPALVGTVALVSLYGLVCYSYLGISYTVLLNLAPVHLRGTVLAIEMVLANLLGYGGGPFLVGVLSDAYGGPQSLRWALLTVNVFYALGAALFLYAAYTRSVSVPAAAAPARR